MNERRSFEPPPPRGAGAGGGGREAFASPSERARGWAPAPDAGARQKDHTRTRERAKAYRKELTASEREMWRLLRGIEGARFRKEVPIDNYVFDFACVGARLLIELDGSVHDRADVQDHDKRKTVYAITQGFRVLRFANNDVWDRPAWVIDQVRACLVAPHPPAPAPQGGGGEESSAL